MVDQAVSDNGSSSPGWSESTTGAGRAGETTGTPVIMPRLDMTTEEMTILRWIKADGDFVRAGDPLLEVMTEKVSIEVEAPATGYVQGLRYGPEAVVPVGQVIAFIVGGDGGQAQDPSVVQAASVEATTAADAPRAAPVVRRMAAELGVDLRHVRGTGPGGRVLAADVRAFAGRTFPGDGSPRPVFAPIPTAGETGGDAPPGARPADAYMEARLTPVRQTIARRMSESWRAAPHVTIFAEIDMFEAAQFRQRLQGALVAEAGAEAPKLTWHRFIAWVAVQALTRHRSLNATLEGDVLRRYDDVHLGVAVDTGSGLVVPVVRQAQRRGPGDLARAIAQLVDRTLSGRLAPAETRGGTFTVTNLGPFGIHGFTPIINPPQIAILGVGAVREQVVPVGGQPAVRPVCTFSLSLDHRAVDGAVGARYLQVLEQLLRSPHRLVV